MVAADDQVGCAIVAADQRVPERLARAGHAHRQRQQRQQDAVGSIVVLRQRLIGAHAREVVHIAGLGHANHRVQQQHAIDALGRALGQLLVGPVQRVARLEGHHILSAKRLQPGARLGRSHAQILKIIARRQLDHLKATRDIQLAPAVHLGHQRVPEVERAKGFLRHLFQIPGVDLLDRHHRQQLVLGVAQRDILAQADRGIGVDRQRHRQREDMAALQAHLVEHALVASLAHKPIERRKRPARQQLKIAERALRDLQRLQPARVGFESIYLFSGNHQVHQLTTIGGNECRGLWCRQELPPVGRVFMEYR